MDSNGVWNPGSGPNSQESQGQGSLRSVCRRLGDHGSSKELLEHEILPVVKAFFAERGLTLSPEKTVITHIREGFDFLGQNVRKYGDKLIIRPSKKSVHTVLQKIRTVIKGNKATSAYNLIWQLNPIITDGSIITVTPAARKPLHRSTQPYLQASGSGPDEDTITRAANGSPRSISTPSATVIGASSEKPAKSEEGQCTGIGSKTRRQPDSKAHQDTRRR